MGVSGLHVEIRVHIGAALGGAHCSPLSGYVVQCWVDSWVDSSICVAQLLWPIGLAEL